MIKCYYIIIFFILLELFNCESYYEKQCQGSASKYEDCYNLIKNIEKPEDSFCCFIKGKR